MASPRPLGCVFIPVLSPTKECLDFSFLFSSSGVLWPYPNINSAPRSRALGKYGLIFHPPYKQGHEGSHMVKAFSCLSSHSSHDWVILTIFCLDSFVSSMGLRGPTLLVLLKTKAIDLSFRQPVSSSHKEELSS